MNHHPAPMADRPAHLGWRLLAIAYDALPVLALWLAFSALVLALRPDHQPLPPWSAGQLLAWLGCWLITGGYAVLSWHRGGQTLGMRPWRLRIIGADGQRPSLAQLVLRYALASASLLAFGLGFFWSLIDGQRRCWHDSLSGTRLVRRDRY